MSNIIQAFPKGGNGGGEEFDFENYTSTFTEASTRANIVSGEKNSTILGKLKRWYSDLKAVAFSGSASDITPDSSHRFVTDTEKSTWNAKQNAITAGSNLTFDGNTLNASIGVMGIVNKSDLYDTTEKVVGKWTDGRPVYQKCVYVPALPNVGNMDVSHGITNLNQVIEIKGYATNSSGTTFPIPNSQNEGAATNPIGISIYALSNKTAFRIAVGSDRSSYSAYITLKYTKTTDAANSYKYADENEYSTTEHIVGSWIDGETLYQRVVTVPLVNATGTTAWISGHSTNISVKNYSGCILSDTNPKESYQLGGSVWYETQNEPDVSVASDGGKLVFRCKTDWTGYTAYAVVQYTKTTG